MRLANLSPDSAWSHALIPYDPSTGHRAARESVITLDDPAQVDAFFARQAGP